MNLHEFITYCQLKGLVKYHMEIPQDYDHRAKHYRIQITNNGFSTSFIYAVLKTVPDQAVLVRSESSTITDNKTLYHTSPSARDIIEGIMA